MMEIPELTTNGRARKRGFYFYQCLHCIGLPLITYYLVIRLNTYYQTIKAQICNLISYLMKVSPLIYVMKVVDL